MNPNKIFECIKKYIKTKAEMIEYWLFLKRKINHIK